MPTSAGCQHLPGDDVQSRQQGGGAVLDIAIGDTFDVAQAHREGKLGAIEGLDWALFHPRTTPPFRPAG